MSHIVTFQVREARMTQAANGIEIGAVMTEDQFVAAFTSYLENSNTTDAQAARLVERLQAELTPA